MGLNAKKVQGNRPAAANLEPDVYPARVVQIIDLGLQAQRPYQGKDKPPVQEIMFTYELEYEFMKDEEGNDLEDKPRWISETLPFYGLFADKAKSTQRIKAFDPNDEFDGELSQMIGTPVNVTVVNNVSGDKVYDNIAAVASMSAKNAAKLPELVNPGKVFDLDEPDLEVFNALPEWIRKRIQENLNYAGSPLANMLGAGKGEKAKVQKQKPVVVEDEEEGNQPY